MQIAILGRQWQISLAELERLFGHENVTPVGEYAAIISSDLPLPQSRLGGTMKSAQVLTKLENTDLPQAFTYLQQSLPGHLQYLEKGKLQLGVSVYGFSAKRDWLLKQMLTLKKIIKKTGQSVRIIENKSEALESAQVLYNKLTGPLGWELLIIKKDADVIIAKTTAVQDIDAYAARDFERPKRDAYVGMLPPKLAQIMINLGVSSGGSMLSDLPLPPHTSPLTILDPFCGTGVVLQEALLMGYKVYGTDLSERMVDYSEQNLEWLEEKWKMENGKWKLEVGDATTHTWSPSPLTPHTSTLAVVCETYLGTPLSSLPQARQLDDIMNEADQIAEGFLKNIASQLEPGARLCLALPAWYLGDGRFKHLKVLDHLTDLGYNRLELVHATNSELIYHREDQVVARELTVLKKI